MPWLLPVVLLTALLGPAAPGPTAAEPASELETVATRARFPVVTEALPEAIAAEGMTLVCHADAQRGAAARGVVIRGNQVFMLFRNDFAVRLLAADPAAGIEAPLRIYVYETTEGTATVSYARPSALFARYRNPGVSAIAAELDPIVKRIVDRATRAR